ncbi:hypothetical protein OG304_38245 [Streptomyces sp. NBC_00160]|uniref:hypothetical protein n=1 Tax=Streptomyces sp. NBC_00160 TaxID=2903628 RepID=UPI00224E8EB8|nr:hypothetical protein [Streptomyces sp. NBC_00160]MCX5309205.1 hypothetical protein [Streptomyces sp. NBC_00160]
MQRSAQDTTRLLHLAEEAARIRMVWEEVATTHCCRPAEEVEAAYAEAAARWDIQVDERTAARSSIYISGCYWE